MNIWKRVSQNEESEKHFFSGVLRITKSVSEALSLKEILQIYRDLKDYVIENNGVNSKQVYEDETGRKLYLTDELEKNRRICKLKFNNEI